MTILEYQKDRLAEIDYFLRGINFNNVGKKIKKYNNDKEYIGIANAMLIDNVQVNGNPFKTRFVNRKEWFPILTEAIAKIKTLYAGLENKFSDDITGANTKEEVDDAILDFIQKVMQIIDELKEHILEDVKIEKNVLVSKSFETSNLGFIEVCLGDKTFNWQSTYVPRRSVSQNDLREKEQVDSAVLILAYIYMMPITIERSSELKSNMLNLINEVEGCFILGSNRHKRIANYFKEIYRLRQGEVVGINKFKEVIQYINDSITNYWEENKISNENNKRYQKLIELYKIAQMMIPSTLDDEVKHTK